MKFSVSEIFTFCCQSCKKLYVCWRSLIRLLAFDVCWRSIIRLRATDFEEFYVCWRSIIRLLAFYVCWRSIIRLLAFYVCWRFTYAGATGGSPPPPWNYWGGGKHIVLPPNNFDILKINNMEMQSWISLKTKKHCHCQALKKPSNLT